MLVLCTKEMWDGHSFHGTLRNVCLGFPSANKEKVVHVEKIPSDEASKLRGAYSESIQLDRACSWRQRRRQQ